jgi:hypothetical protein
MVECEIKRGGEWKVIGIAEALELRAEPLRCVACHVRVLPNREYSDGAQPHFSHLLAFAYCTRELGEASPAHPNALVGRPFLFCHWTAELAADCHTVAGGQMETTVEERFQAIAGSRRYTVLKLQRWIEFTPADGSPQRRRGPCEWQTECGLDLTENRDGTFDAPQAGLILKRV